MRLWLAGAALAAAFVLRELQVPPVPGWFYLFAWYPTLLLLDALIARLGGESLLARPRALAAMLWWSAVIWFLFEALNFRLGNWYYVFVPAEPAVRWAGIVVSFATVVPAIFLPARLLERLGVWRALRTRPLVIRERDLVVTQATGVTLLAAILLFPRFLYPLVWGAVWAIAEPALYRARPGNSLFGDLARGEWGRIARLMAGGLFAGLLWEAYNAGERGKWIYTVPFLEDLKLFEMPVLGFLGFPFFALEAWSLYHLLAPRTRPATVLPSVAFAIVVLLGIDRWTVSSTQPRLRDLPGVPSDVVARLERADLADVFGLAALPPNAAAARAGLSPEDARRVRDAARLATLRGIGTQHAAALMRGGITTVEALARTDPDSVWRAVATDGSPRPTPAEVRVWRRAAEQASVN